MAVAELTKTEQRYKRNDEVRKKFHEYMEKRRYPRMKLIAKDAGLDYISFINFNNEKGTISHESLDKLEEFMKHN